MSSEWLLCFTAPSHNDLLQAVSSTGAMDADNADDDDEFMDVPLLPAPAKKKSTQSSARGTEAQRESQLSGATSSYTSQQASSHSSRRGAESPTSRRRRLLRQSGRASGNKDEEDVATMHVGGQRVFIDRLRVSLPSGGRTLTAKNKKGGAAENSAAAATAAAPTAASAAAEGCNSTYEDRASIAERRERLLAKAPVVSYGPDLMFWGAREKKSTGELSLVCRQYRGAAPPVPGMPSCRHLS